MPNSTHWKKNCNRYDKYKDNWTWVRWRQRNNFVSHDHGGFVIFVKDNQNIHSNHNSLSWADQNICSRSPERDNTVVFLFYERLTMPCHFPIQAVVNGCIARSIFEFLFFRHKMPDESILIWSENFDSDPYLNVGTPPAAGARLLH